jgi:hypothetical protein
MDLESSVGNRVAFERCRAAAQEHENRMSPSMSADHYYKLGIGLARFGKTSRAREALRAGLELAEKHRLNAWYFKLEQALEQLSQAPDQQLVPRPASELSEAPLVRELELGLREYALSGV